MGKNGVSLITVQRALILLAVVMVVVVGVEVIGYISTKGGKMKFTKAPNKLNRGISMLIYGDPGTGKTTLCGTLPAGETLIIDVEAGEGPLIGSNHLMFRLDRDLKQLQSLYKYIRTEDHPFKYICIDNISELQEWIVRVIMETRSKEFTSIKEYGDASFKMKEYITLFRDLTTVKNMTVIFTAWEMNIDIEQSGGTIVTKAFPKVFKKIAPDIAGYPDIVAHLEKAPKTDDRFLRFESTGSIVAKTQLKGLDKFEPAHLPSILKKLYEYDYGAEKEEEESVAEKINGGKK